MWCCRPNSRKARRGYRSIWAVRWQNTHGLPSWCFSRFWITIVSAWSFILASHWIFNWRIWPHAYDTHRRAFSVCIAAMVLGTRYSVHGKIPAKQNVVPSYYCWRRAKVSCSRQYTFTCLKNHSHEAGTELCGAATDTISLNFTDYELIPKYIERRWM